MTPEQITHIVDAYAFSPDDKSTLTDLISTAYLHAKQAAYQRAHTTAGHRTSLPAWRPGDADATKAHEWAVPLAERISETYSGLLKSQLEQMEEEGMQEALGDVIRGIKGIVNRISDWFKDFIGWKTDQIADNTWNEGDNDGTEQFIEDVIASGTDYSAMRVRVMPEESSSDFCSNYAGRDFAFDAVGSELPEFPAHNRCIHYLEIYVEGE